MITKIEMVDGECLLTWHSGETRAFPFKSIQLSSEEVAAAVAAFSGYVTKDGTIFKSAERLSQYQTLIEQLEEEVQREVLTDALAKKIKERASFLRARLLFEEWVEEQVLARGGTQEIADWLNNNMGFLSLPGTLEAPRHGGAWISLEDNLLWATYQRFLKIMARRFGRSPGAISSHLYHLSKS